MTRLLPLLGTTALDDVPRTGSDRSLTAVAQVVSVSAGGRAVTVSLLGSAPITLPATVTSWTSVRTCYVLLDAATGRPVHVLGPAPEPSGPLPDPPPARGPVPTTQVVTVPAQWAGTYTATTSGQSGWGTWETTSGGATTDLYQGASGSATLRSLATYGRHVQALGADRLDHVVLRLTPAVDRTWTARIQAATWTETGPAATGQAVTATLTGLTPLDVDVTTLAPALAGGAGLALTGSGYGAVSGQGSSMSLTITYTSKL